MLIDLTAPILSYGKSPDITHMDLFYMGWASPLESLVTRCVVLDLENGSLSTKTDSLPGLDMLSAGWSVILRTGWEQYRGTPQYAMSPSTDKWLLERLIEKKVCLVMVDSPGVFGGASGPEHNDMDKKLAEAGAFAVENLVGVSILPTGIPFTLYCFPLQMTELNNAPCRIVADVDL